MNVIIIRNKLDVVCVGKDNTGVTCSVKWIVMVTAGMLVLSGCSGQVEVRGWNMCSEAFDRRTVGQAFLLAYMLATPARALSCLELYHYVQVNFLLNLGRSRFALIKVFL